MVWYVPRYWLHRADLPVRPRCRFDSTQQPALVGQVQLPLTSPRPFTTVLAAFLPIVARPFPWRGTRASVTHAGTSVLLPLLLKCFVLRVCCALAHLE